MKCDPSFVYGLVDQTPVTPSPNGLSRLEFEEVVSLRHSPGHTGISTTLRVSHHQGPTEKNGLRYLMFDGRVVVVSHDSIRFAR